MRLRSDPVPRPLRSLLLLLLCGAFCIRGGAQRGPAQDWVVELPFTTFTTANGLVHNRCGAVREDGRGYIWAATNMGICRYDGRSFRHFPQPGDTPYGAILNNSRDGDCVLFPIFRFGAAVALGDSVRFFRAANLALGPINGIVRTGDSSFLLSDAANGLLLLNGSTATRQPLPDPVQPAQLLDLTKDSRGNVWLGSTDGLLFLPGGRVAAAFRLPFWNGTYLNAVRQDASGNILIVSDKGLYRYPATLLDRPQALARALPSLLMPMQGRGFPTVYAEPGGALWVGSFPAGAHRIDPADGSSQTFTPRNGFAAQTVWDITGDHEGNIWFATENGLCRLSRSDLVRISFRLAVSDQIKFMVPLTDRLQLLSNDGEGYYTVSPQGEVNRVSTRPDPGGYYEERHRKMADGHLWITSCLRETGVRVQYSTMVCDYEAGKLIRRYPITRIPGAPAQFNFTRSAARSRNGDEWLLEDSTLYLLHGGRFYHYRLEGPDGRPATAATVCMGGDGLLHAFFRGGGTVDYAVLPEDGARPYALLARRRRTDAVLRERPFNRSFCDSRGWVWLYGRDGGLALVPPGPDAVRLLNPLLSAAYVTSLAEDSSGALWIGTAFGLDKAVVDGGSIRVTKGLYAAELCGRYIFFARPVGGKLYIGTTGCLGIADLRAGDRRLPAQGPPVYLSRLLVNGQDRSALLRSGGAAALPPGDNNLSFEFTGLSYFDEKSVRYSYLLEGVDKAWSPPGTDYRVTYSRLSPGDYTFLVRAAGRGGVLSRQPAAFRFRIAKPFYSTWWFLLLCLGAASGAVYLLYRYRINQLLALQQMRQRISKDLHDDIGATVSSIGILADMVKDGRGSAERQRQFLETIAEESRYVAQTLSDIVWTINPRNDSLEAIFARMQRYASELFEARGIQYHIALPQQTGDAALDMQARQHLYLLFKEAVNNLAKYAGATEAVVTSTLGGGRLQLTVRDNGRGFDPSAATAGNGIANMRKRAAEMRARLTLRSSPGAGTEVVLDAPVG